MPWIKLDDQWMRHPKIVRAGRDARDVWLASLTWCAEYLTNGFFPPELLPTFAIMADVDLANCQQIASILLDVCLWERTENGYHIHDYEDYNPSKEQVEATRKARSEAGRVGAKAKASQSKQNASKLLSKTETNDKQNSAPSPSPSPSPNQEIKESADALLSQSGRNQEEAKTNAPKKPTAFHDPMWDILHGLPPQTPPANQPPDVEWVPADIQEHMCVFFVSTGLPVPLDKSTRGWWIKEMQANRQYGLTPADIKATITRMRETNTFIKSPGSLRAIGLDMKSVGSVPRIDPEAERIKRITASIYREDI